MCADAGIGNAMSVILQWKIKSASIRAAPKTLHVTHAHTHILTHMHTHACVQGHTHIHTHTHTHTRPYWTFDQIWKCVIPFCGAVSP